MFHGKRVVLMLSFAVLAMMVCAPSAFGQATTSDMSFSSLVINDCTGDPVLITGTLHTEASFSTNPNGMTHTSLNFTTHATGVDQVNPALNYVINDNSHEEVNSKGNAQEQSIGTKMKMISQGPSSNLTERSTLHVVIDSNNNVKVEKSKTQVSCK